MESTTSKAARPKPSRRVVLLIVAPILILILFSVAIRLASEAQAIAGGQGVAGPPQNPGGGRIQGFLPGGANPPLFQTADAKTQARIEATVRGQLKSISKGDFAEALSYSDTQFRSMESPSQFQSMIVGGFSEMTSYRDVQFTQASVQSETPGYPRLGRLVVTLIGKDGVKTRYDYTVSGRADGWFVQGVSHVPVSEPPDQGTSSLNLPISG